MGRVGWLKPFKRLGAKFQTLLEGPRTIPANAPESTWTLESEIPRPRNGKSLDFAQLRSIFPYGFRFRTGTKGFDLTEIFSHGEVFRPDGRCAVDPSLIRIGDGVSITVAGPWLKALGFGEFESRESSAVLFKVENREVWVVIDPRAEVFRRPLLERLISVMPVKRSPEISP